MSESELRKAVRDLIDAFNNGQPYVQRIMAVEAALSTPEISCKGILDNSTPEPSREPTQEQVEAWALDADMPQTRVAWKTVHERDFFYEALQRFATLAHAAGFDAGMRAGGKDAERWTYFLSRVRGERSVDGRGQFIQPKIKPVGGIMSGSIAEHFKNAIDAAIAKDTKHG